MIINKKNIFILIVIGFFLLYINFCFAEGEEKPIPNGEYATSNYNSVKYEGNIFVTNEAGDKIMLKDTAVYYASKLKEWAVDEAWKELKNSSAIGYKVALKAFLNQLAHDTAVKLASGGKGQSPLIESRPMSDIIRDAADNAVGLALKELGKKGMFGEKFNLCEPDLSVKYSIIFGLQNQYHPQKPACTFSTMLKNWDQELKKPDFLPKFQDLFKPESNDLGIALSVQTNIITKIDKEINAESLTAVKNGGYKDVVDNISGWVRTPGTMVKRAAEITAEEADKNLFVYTGSVAADAIDTFASTLIGSLLSKWLNTSEGMNTTAPAKPDWNIDLNSPNSQNTNEGVAGANDRYKSLIEPKFNVRGDYNILSELTICSDPTKAGPTNCVITDNFRQAIENKKTVGEAMKEGFLNAGGIFGFTSDGLEPPYNEGYPYRSMPILRKFRIIPVGWEIAAEYIKDFGGKTYNLGDMVACFDPNDDYAGLSEDWCHGLVDPNWVLKAPLNYCKREGAGPEIISDQIMGEGYTSQRMISRNDNYCADEQSCIKENDDGSCQLYGYCTEERRKWQMNGNSCEPKYNTCQTFKSEAGNTVSYLENTLDYGNCNADNAGCKAYCTAYDFANSKWTCTAASTGDKIHLDKNAETCDAENEGCSEVIRTKAGIGANLIKNSSFENYTGTIDDGAGDSFDLWRGIGEAVSGGFDAATAVKLSSNLTEAIDVAPADYSIAGEIYSFSFYAKNCADTDTFAIDGQADQKLNNDADWMPYETTHAFPKNTTGNKVTIKINSSTCLIDAIKLERGQAGAYYDYRGTGLDYLKIAPDYLNCDGNGDPAECGNFARKCQADEVGCDLYTSATDNSSIPAKALAQDYCAAECVGYDAYIQGASPFDSLRSAYFIPKTAKACGSSEAGCDQFTNLDEVEKGGEGTEYYSNLRQCVRTDDPAANCGEFYTWEGSDEAGYQLRVHQLAKNGAEPAVTENDSAECDKDIYSLSPADPAYNPDCREFYNKEGDVYYHLYTRTKTCSADCHPYRRSENNIDPAIANPANCNANGSGYAGVKDSQFHWDGTANSCYFCKNGGEWNDEQNACIYMAIPSEGVRCSAGDNGCREYRGNAGNNVKNISVSDFEGSLQNWAGVNTTVELSNTALINGGNSLFVKDGDFSAALKINEAAAKGNTYVISFIAKSAGGEKISSIKLMNGANVEAAFSVGDISLNAEWKLYKANLSILDHNVDADEKLIIAGDGAFYVDDIKFVEITDVYYLIKNSWETPDACYYDMQNNYVGPYFNAGCDEYKDRDNITNYLHQFSRLCSDSAIGCEVMINTHNSKDYNAQTFNAGDPSEITVPADSYDYIVYDKTKKCGQEDKACQRLGKPTAYGDTVLYGDVYLKNDPDKYNLIMCKADEVYCGQWTSNDGTIYFKDPGDMLCEWRQKAGQASGSWGWYKTKVKRCDINKDNNIGPGETDICLSSSDCASGIGCIMDNNDYSCPTTNIKTLGIGGAGNSVLQPAVGTDGNWAGLCPAAQAGCTEYIEPVSRFMPNMLFNGEFSQDVDNNHLADGWTAEANGAQDSALEANTLYILAVEGDNTAILNGNNFYELNNNNSLNGPVSQITVSSSAGARTSKRFYAAANVSIKIIADNGSANNGSKVELKQAIIDYKLKQDLDETTCNGIVDFEQGCVLFNKRAQNGNNLEAMKWDADLTVNDGTGISPQAGADTDKDANIILKVSPDRVCDKWLACRSYIKDENGNNVCFDIGACDGVDDNGNCSSFVVTKKINQTYPLGDIGKIANLAGYTIAGVNWGANKIEGDFPAGEMEQEGQTANVSNGGFEYYGSNGYPIGWSYTGAISWNVNVFSVVNNPFSAQVEGIGFAPEGNSFLKLGSEYSATSEYIDVVPDMDYILTAYINTKNLPGNSASVNIEQFRSGSGSLAPGGADIVSLAGSNDWTYQLGYFKTDPSAAKIKITLHSQAGATGNFYFDDIKIKPALYSKDTAGAQGSPWYTSQTCRLYPKTDSLSCEYYDDSGIINKGWSGYCLQYDRYPGSRDACILWWPTDKVKGEGIEEGAGYLGKMPVYYCAETTLPCGSSGRYCNKIVQTVSSVGQNKYWSGRVYEGSNYIVADNTIPSLRYNYTTAPSPFGSIIPGNPTNDPYQWDSDPTTPVFTPLYYKPNSSESNQGEIYQYDRANCGNTFTHGNHPQFYGLNQGDKGDLGFWDNCIKDVQGCNDDTCIISGSNVKKYMPPGFENYPFVITYEVPDYPEKNGLGYYDTPMGKYWVAWGADGDGNHGVLFWSQETCSSNSDKPGPAKELISRLFVQSYGYWRWDNVQKHYVKDNEDWSSPKNICSADPRPAYPNDLCGIKPKIFNLKANNQAGSFEVNNSQFINFTFNTAVDSQQLPLVLYAIDWGDNEFTSVSGVEMRDRPNADNPHSMYHLYSYWDLKAKNATDQTTNGGKNTVYCGNADAVAKNYSGAASGHTCVGSACCVIKPSAKVQDNWGWCQDGVNNNPCPGGYQSFGGWIVVKEK